jgi:uncharacterized protein (DUF433 family)
MPALTDPPMKPSIAVPLRWDNGVWRIGPTNLTLEAVVQLYEGGLDADEIAREFDGLGVAIVHQVLGCYLAHRDEFTPYLAARKAHLVARHERGKAAAREMRARLAARA